MKLTERQLDQLKRLWFIYGNRGKKSTLFNHKLIQGFVEHNEDRREDYKDINKRIEERFGKEKAKIEGITQDCLDEINKILS